METQRGNAADHDNACARVAARFHKPWLRHYVRGKLRRDRVYQTAYDLLRSSAGPILDVGCGVGLLGFYLQERGCGQTILGVDVDARKIHIGAEIAAAHYHDIELCVRDVGKTIPGFSGNVALFDLLHYLPPARQTALLGQLADCVAPGGLLIIRDCPRDAGPRYWITLLAEKFAQAISWNLDSPLHFPSRASIEDVFDAAKFERETRPLWGASPFNNHIFIFRRRGAGVSPVRHAGFQPASSR
jgi:2-polyprenyl-3-methyl-5-hydroxy-6-metoxy-1,4-benzoquinol methylase